jgi:hypothetical protein
VLLDYLIDATESAVVLHTDLTNQWMTADTNTPLEDPGAWATVEEEYRRWPEVGGGRAYADHLGPWFTITDAGEAEWDRRTGEHPPR